jgi:lipopolysaccharide/colanic/teichoic acid biosynthesis glycosyltransferase
MLEKRIPFYRTRLLVKPGLMGWAQVNYRYGNSVNDTYIKLQHDLYYIKNRSIWLDMLIWVRTIRVVLSFQGT